MRSTKTQAILDDALALVRRSSVATAADISQMEAIAVRDVDYSEHVKAATNPDGSIDFLALLLDD